MIYELKNMRIKVREIDFLNDLNVVANRLGKKTLTQRDYKNNEPKYSLNNAINRFGRWEDLLIKANVVPDIGENHFFLTVPEAQNFALQNLSGFEMKNPNTSLTLQTNHP